MINLKLPKNIRKNEHGEFILTDKTGKRWDITKINMIIDEFEEKEKEESAKMEDKFDRSKIHPKKRLEILKQIMK